MADNNEDYLSVNSDFEGIPNTPMEREDTDVDDLDLVGGQETPKGFAASKSANIDLLVATLVKKVDMLVVQNDKLGKENSGLLIKVDAMDREVETLRERLPSAELLAEFMHRKEHETAKFMLVDNSKGAMWDTSTSQLNVRAFTVIHENGGISIRSTHGFSTVPIDSNSDSLIYNIHYFEVSIDEMLDEYNQYIGLVAKDYPMNKDVGYIEHEFSIVISNRGSIWLFLKRNADFGSGFTKGDVVGCGLMVVQKTKNAEAAKCEQCNKPHIFFTKNGELLGTPIPLPSADVPSTLYPAISLSCDSKMTANFGHQPFKYAIPPAKGLNTCGHCCHCKKFVA